MPSPAWKKKQLLAPRGPGLVPRRDGHHGHRAGLHARDADSACERRRDVRGARHALRAAALARHRRRRDARDELGRPGRAAGRSRTIRPSIGNSCIDAMVGVTAEPRGTARRVDEGPGILKWRGKTGTAQVITIAQDEKYREEDIDERVARSRLVRRVRAGRRAAHCARHRRRERRRRSPRGGPRRAQNIGRLFRRGELCRSRALNGVGRPRGGRKRGLQRPRRRRAPARDRARDRCARHGRAVQRRVGRHGLVAAPGHAVRSRPRGVLRARADSAALPAHLHAVDVSAWRRLAARRRRRGPDRQRRAALARSRLRHDSSRPSC